MGYDKAEWFDLSGSLVFHTLPNLTMKHFLPKYLKLQHARTSFCTRWNSALSIAFISCFKGPKEQLCFVIRTPTDRKHTRTSRATPIKLTVGSLFYLRGRINVLRGQLCNAETVQNTSMPLWETQQHVRSTQDSVHTFRWSYAVARSHFRRHWLHNSLWLRRVS